MKKASLIIIVVASLPLFGQTITNRNLNSKPYSENSDIKIFQENDTISKRDNLKSKLPAFFINGIFVNETIFRQLNPSKIDSIYIENTDFEKEGRIYNSKLFVEMNPEYSPNYLTLKALVNKYLEMDANPIIFQIGDKIIDEDYEKYLIDENFILKIIKSKIQMSNAIEINLIKIISKTEENIKKENGTQFREN